MSGTHGTLDYATPANARKGRGLFGWVLFIGLAIMLFVLLTMKNRNYTPVSFSEFNAQVISHNVSAVALSDTEATGKYFRTISPTTGTPVQFFRCSLPVGLWGNLTFIDRLNSAGADVRFDNNQNLWVNVLLPLVPWLLIFGFIWFFVFRQLRNNAATRAPAAVPVVSIGTTEAQQ